ncbi:glycosyl hydrolase family 43 [Pyrenophora seminiperda CCB06]|uniref:Endo-1,5-alpha-L-arabinanase A n=1 Tax=Pyrenophora seminiperda CCB06 TaxID=1302712 RepID=A0A3M7M1B0_9PLEO|nr:glycosyl hydrolase family 43 [Pyrenophora seminiperda CCB06]
MPWSLWSIVTVQANSAESQIQAALSSLTVTNVEDVSGNLYLPGTSDGLNVTWSSNNPSIISADGIVRRQDSATTVDLTAVIEHDGTTSNRTFSANVRQAFQLDAFEGYAFTYFTGNSIAGEKIYIAASNGNNALDWVELNGGQPILTSTMGTKGLRDPFVMRSVEGDKFFLLATDLSIGSGTSWGDSVKRGSLYLEIWESSDLKTWSAQRHVKVSPPTAGNTWAPEAYYDADLGSYVVFWASSLYADTDKDRTGATYHRMLYVTTRDFVTFSDPQIWQDAGMSRIDTTVIQEDGVFYRFTKDEGATGTGCSDIIEERSSKLLDPVASWTQVVACIGRNAGTSAVEGPTVFKSNPGDVNGEKFYLFVDEYGGRGYIPLETADIANPTWKELAGLKTNKVSFTTRRRRAPLEKRVSPVLPGLYADPNIAPFLTLNGTSGNVPWADGNAWAPTIIERNGKYYFYFSGDNPTYKRKTIGVAIGTSPTGPFSAQPTAMILNDGPVKTGQAIDPAVFKDPTTGKYYIFYGNGGSDITGSLYAELNDDMISLKTNSTKAITGLTDFREGIFVNYRKGLFHLTYSIDDTGSENYRVGYATATSVHGPWTYRGVVLQKDVAKSILATGHSSIVNVPGTDDWYIAYHRFRIPGGDGQHRETTVDRVYFDGEGFMKMVVPTLGSVGAERVP